MSEYQDLTPEDVNWTARLKAEKRTLGWAVRMRRPGQLALEEERQIEKKAREGREDGVAGPEWLPEDRYAYILAAHGHRQPPPWMYAVAYGGPGKSVVYETIRLEHAKVWMLQRPAEAAAMRHGGEAVRVELAVDPRRDELIPCRVAER